MKKFKKLVSSILITMLTVATLGSFSAVKAASAGPLYLGMFHFVEPAMVINKKVAKYGK